MLIVCLLKTPLHEVLISELVVQSNLANPGPTTMIQPLI